MTISFFKMQATGNDFLVLDNRRRAVADRRGFSRRFSDRRMGAGADGVLYLEPCPPSGKQASRRAHYRMRIFNRDGSEAEMCANGIRCIALFASRILKVPRSHDIQTRAGKVSAVVRGPWGRHGERGTVRVLLTEPTDYRSVSHLAVGGVSHPFYFVNTGVPHTVIFRDDLQHFPVAQVGAKIRAHPHFKPRGTNVNFVKVTGRSRIRVRTFERGVEAETPSCGTGATASAIVSVLAGFCKPPITVETSGGEELEISFDYDRFHVYNLFLEGKAHFVYEGRVHV